MSILRRHPVVTILLLLHLVVCSAFILLREPSISHLEERERMREKLIQILKTIPTFVIIALPQKFLTLPILLKILPKNLFADGVPD